jgi:hypothetical protein
MRTEMILTVTSIGERSMERQGDREKRGERQGGQLLNICYFFCVAIDPRFKLFDYVKKMATMVMLGDEIGEKLWAIVNTYFCALF